MNPEDNSLESGYQTSEGGFKGPANTQVSPNKGPGFNFLTFKLSHLAAIVTIATAILVVLIGGSALLYSHLHGSKSPENSEASSGTFKVGSTINVQQSSPSQLLQLGQVNELAVNGQLTVSKSVVLSPSSTPTTPVTGEIYYNQSSNAPYYYNGSEFVSLLPSAAPQHVTTLGGSAGIISLGSGLSINGNTLSIASSILQDVSAASSTPVVKSLQGLTGNVTFSGGSGIAISGTSITNTGVVGLSSPNNSINITNTGNGNYELSLSAGAGSVTLAPSTAQSDSSSNSSIFINKTGSGNSLELEDNSVDAFVVNQAGQITTGTINYSQVQGRPATVVSSLGGESGDITTGSGLSIASNVLSNSGVVTIGSVSGAIALGSGLSITGNSLSNSGVTSLNGTPNQINASSSTGSITISLPQDIATTSSPTFNNGTLHGTLNVQGGLTVGIPGDSTGNIYLANTSGTNTVDLVGENPSGTGIGTIQFPTIAGGTTDTVCLESLANCGSSSDTVTTSSAGNTNDIAKFTGAETIADSSISDNGSEVTIGELLNASTINTSTIESSNALSINPGGNLSVGAYNHSLSLIGNSASTFEEAANGYTDTLAFSAPTTASNTITVPDATGTVCLDNSLSCGFATSGAGVTSVDNLAGALSINDTTGTGTTITIQNASTTQAGIAEFNSSDFQDNANIIDTIQGITTTSDVEFDSLALDNGSTCAAGGNLCLGNNGTLYASNYSNASASNNVVFNAGNNNVDFENDDGANSFLFPTYGGTGQTICTSGITCASGGGQAVILGPSGVQDTATNTTGIYIDKTAGTGNLLTLQTGSSQNALTIDSSGNATFYNTTSASTLDVSGTLQTETITPNAALSVGSTSQSFTLQGNESSEILGVASSNSTYLGFNTPNGNSASSGSIYYALDNSAATNTQSTPYFVCTTAGNCAGAGGSVAALSGSTSDYLPLFTTTQGTGGNIEDSIATETGSNSINILGNLNVGTTGNSQLSVGLASSVNGTIVINNATNAKTITISAIAAPSSNVTLNLPTTSGTFVVSATGPLSLNATTGVISCPTCDSSGGGGSSAVQSLNSLVNAIDINNASTAGQNIQINYAKADSTTLGIAAFNATNFVDNGSGVINTIQGIASSSSPTFANLSLQGTTGLTIGSAANDGAETFLDGTNDGFTQKLSQTTLSASQTIAIPNASGTLAVSASGNLSLSALGNLTITSSPTFTTSVTTPLLASSAGLNITPGGSLVAGSTTQSFTLQGNASSSITATNGSYTSTLSFDTPTTNNAIYLPNGGGTVCLSSNNCSYEASGNYILNQTSQQTSANFNISGAGTIGTTLTVSGTGSSSFVGPLGIGTTTPSDSFEVLGLADFQSGLGDGVGAPISQSTPGQYSFVVPASVSFLNVDAAGAQGSGSGAGMGARVQAEIPVTPGETVYYTVGGDNGYNGGGSGSNGGGSGGGATDIRINGTSLTNRVLVAGGGGGGGGSAGGSAGQNGSYGGPNTTYGGGGGTQSGGGGGGGGEAQSGSLGAGGNSLGSSGWAAGGGGSGYYGGGGGWGENNYGAAGGGGGSSYSVASGTTYTSAYETANGYIDISYAGSPNAAVFNGDVAVNGTELVQDTSTTALQIQNSSGASILTADTTDNRIDIGTNGTASGQLYVSGTNPTYVGENSDSNINKPYSVFVSGNYAYVTSDNSDKLLIYNISSGTPVYVSENSDSNMNSPFSVYVSGNYAYVASLSNSKLLAYNISSGTPVYVGENSDSNLNAPISVYVSGNYAYVACTGNNKLVVYNISSGTPVYVSENSDSNLNHPDSVYVQGNYAYVSSSGNNKLVVYNISSGTPVYVSENSDSSLSSPDSVYVSSNYAYVSSSGNNELVVYNISSGTPVYVGENSDSNLSNPYSVYVSGNYAYVASYGNNKLVVYNIVSGTPVYVGENSDSNLNEPAFVFVSGNYAYVASQGNNKLVSYSIGGTVTQSLQAGSTTVSTLQVAANAIVSGDESIQGGLTVGTNEEVSGNEGIGGTLNVNTLYSNSTSALTIDTGGAAAINIGTTNANSITLGNSANTTTTSIIANTTLNLGNNANNKTINVGATGSTANTTALNLATSTGAAQTIDIGGIGGSGTNSNSSTTVNLQGGTTSESLSSSGETLTTYTNSTSAFVVQNTSGAVLNVDTTDGLSQLYGVGNAIFSYTGSTQTYTVPAGVSSITVDMAAGGGGSGDGVAGAGGGRLQATIPVTPGHILTIYVASQGGNGGPNNGQSYPASPGGYGYGTGGTGGAGATGSGGGGGGATAIYDSTSSTLLAVVGGGGGGALVGLGGAGSGDGNGANGAGGAAAGGGATTSSVGAGGSGCSGNFGSSGSGNNGGAGEGGSYPGGGGGAGYYGGGGGAQFGGTGCEGSGGGGSGFIIGSASNVTNTNGYETTNGYLEIFNTQTEEQTVSGTGVTDQSLYSNSTTAFEVQNASSVSLLTVDTTDGNVTLDNTGSAGTVQIGNTSGAGQTINIGNNTTVGSSSNVNIGSSTGGSIKLQAYKVIQSINSGTGSGPTMTSSGEVEAGNSPQTIALPATTKANDAIIVTSSLAGNPAMTVSGAGATWVQYNYDAINPALNVWVGYGATAGSTSITLTGGGLDEGGVVIGIFSGVAYSSDPVLAESTGSGGPATTGSVSYSPGDLVIGAASFYFGSGSWNTPVWSNGSPNNNIQVDSDAREARSDYQVATTSGSTTYSVSTTGGASGDVLALVLAPSSGGGNDTIQSASSSALEVQDILGNGVFNVDTTDSRVGVGTLATPTNVSVGAATGGGSLAASTTYYIKVTAIDGSGGETVASSEASGSTTPSNLTLPITWNSVPGAVSYRVYYEQGGSGGAEANFFTTSTNSYNLTTISGSSAAAPPTASSAYADRLSSSSNTLQSLSNSSTAFQIQNSSGTNLFQVDTSGNNIYLGGNTNSTEDIGAVGTAAYTSSINIGTSSGAAQAITIGSTNSSSSLTLQAGEGITVDSSINQSISSGSSTGTISLLGQIATNANTGPVSTTVNADSITLIGTNNSNSGENTLNGLSFNNVASATNNTFNGLYFGSGYTNGINFSTSTGFSSFITAPGFNLNTSGGLSLGTIGTTAGSLTLNSSHSDGNIILEPTSSQANTVTINIPTDTSSIDYLCLVNVGNCSGINGGSGDSAYIFNQTTQQASSNIDIQSVSGNVAAKIQGSSGQDILNLYSNSSSTTPVDSFDSSGDLNINTNTTDALLVQDTSGSLLTADTADQRVDIGTNGTPTGQLYVSGTVPTYVGENSDSNLSGPVSVFVSGSYAYITSENTNKLVVYNISSGTPVYVGENSDSNLNEPYAVYVAGGYAYVTSIGNNKLVVYNISSGTPVYVGENSDSNLNTPKSVYVSGNYAYVVSQSTNKLVVYNISSGTPVYVGENSDSNLSNPLSVYIQSDYAYVVSEGNNKLVVYNISSGTPVYVSENSDSNMDAPRAVFISGSYAYVANYTSDKLTVYNISSGTPVYVGENSDSNLDIPTAVYVAGNYAYVTSWLNNELVVYNISSGTPVYVGENSDSNLFAPESVYVAGGYAYVASSNGELVSYSLGGTVTQSLQAGSTSTNTLNVQANAIVSGDESIQGGLTVGTNAQIDGSLGVGGQLNVAGASPTYVGQNSDSNLDGPVSVFVSGNYAYVPSYFNNKLMVYNISSGTPVYVSENSDSNLNDPFSVYVSGNYAYVVSRGNNKLVVYNISSGTPVYVSENSDSNLSTPFSVYVSGNYAYVVNDTNPGKLVVYNISSGTPVYVSENSDSNLNYAYYVYVSGNYAYVVNEGNSKLVVYNISSGTPVYVSENSDSNLSNPRSAYISGNYAYVVSSSNNELVVYNISSGTPVYVGENSDSNLDNPFSVYVSGNYAYVASEGNSKLVVYNISSGTPVYVGENSDSNLDNPEFVYVQGNYAYVASEGGNKLVSYNIGGIVTPSLQAGSTSTTTLQVADNAIISGDESVQGGLTVGTNEEVIGNLGVGGALAVSNIDTAGSATLNIGTNNASAINIGHSGVTTTINGNPAFPNLANSTLPSSSSTAYGPCGVGTCLYPYTSVTLTPGTWLVWATATICTQINPDGTFITLSNGSGTGLLPYWSSIYSSPICGNGQSNEEIEGTITVSSSTAVYVLGNRNGESEIEFPGGDGYGTEVSMFAYKLSN